MKVIFFIESLNSGGKERRLVELIKLFTTRPNFTMELVLAKENIHYKNIFLYNIKIHILNLHNNFKKDPRVLYQFYKITKKFKPDIIHVWGNLVAFYAIPAKLILNIPMINNQITDAPIKRPSSIFGPKITFPFSDLIIANSEAGLNAYKAPLSKSKVLSNGFDFSRIKDLKSKIDVKKKFKINTKFVVGMVASFSELKDYKTYINAANQVVGKFLDITFLCIGSGDDSDYRIMVDPENRDRILFLGRQDNVESIMNICDIGVLATYTEGISNALLEFSALEKPVIATDGGGTKELIEEGETGFLISLKSVEQLVNRISYLIENNNEGLRMGKNGKKNIQENFSNKKMLESYLKVYESFVKR